MSKLLWQPSEERKASTNIAKFMAFVNDRHGSNITSYEALHDFSVNQQEKFWVDAWDFSGVKAETRGERIIVDGDKMPGARYFPDARLNYAENMLQRRDDNVSLIFRGEDKVRREVTANQLHDDVSRMHAAFAALGLAPGDRVCAITPNMPETIVAFLGAVSLGGTWSSCSPDFGVEGVLDRFGQVEPRFLVVCDGYYYNGKTHDIGDKVREIAAQLPTVEKVIVINYIGQAAELAGSLPKAVTMEEFMAPHEAGEIAYAQLPFDHPIYILFSSGTTGVPKCIVHTQGAALMKHCVEQRLQTDVRPDDKLFFFTTCGWMMWNWLVSALATECTVLLYDGSPFYPNEKVIFDFADDTGMTIFGTSAKFIDAVKKTGWEPKTTHSLETVRMMCSTGSTLAPESFDFVYDSIKSDIHLASMSGGTDICGCFVAGNPMGPVYRSEIQANGLGMGTNVYDDDGNPCPAGVKGELVCDKAFPSMPLMFWNDPDGAKYHAAYFDRFDNVWCHGDFAEWTENGGMVIHGRSDATLNPGGVRIGTSEIYAQVEKLSEVIEGLCIGQSWDDDTRIVLFVRLADGVTLDEELTKKIKSQIRTGASPRHVPGVVVAVDDIPRTKSGKITELAVRDVVHGREVKNKEALANPEALDLFKNIHELTA
ncbi:MAG: acetoacetate--CoA ligase [Rhizobiales bacterium]|nr:acetoacetate--CoA ligase [Hyphomicrobiales bacterium]